MTPNDRWSGRPSSTSAASRIMPAHVPNTGKWSVRRSAMASKRPDDSSSIDIVVDSPPGMTRASTRARSAGVRTSLARAPSSVRATAWSPKAPWSARTPTVGFTWRPRVHSPAPFRQLHRDLVHADAGHGLAQTAAHLGQDVGVTEVGGGLDDGLGPRGGVGRLEDARPDEDRLGTELHDEGGIGRGGHAAGAEQRHGEPAGLGYLLHEGQRRLETLGPLEQLGGVGLGDLAHVADDRAQVA